MRGAAYLQLGRVSNVPTVVTNVLAATILASGTFDPRTFVPLVVGCVAFYVGGMFLNDAFDREIDARERPERPIPSGVVRAGEVFAVGFGLLAVGVLAVAWSARVSGQGLKPVASGATLAGAVVLYDVWHKGNPLSPVVMGACRVLVYVTAALVVAGTVSSSVAVGAACLFAYLVGLTYAAKIERKERIQPITILPLACMLAPFVHAATIVRDGAGASLYLGFLAWTLWGIGELVKGRVPRAVAALIAGISLLDAVLIARAGHPLIAAYAAVGFAATWSLQRWIRGTYS